jgi:ubiquinone/menaquinone biosynthesis C-methylase UbiE
MRQHWENKYRGTPLKNLPWEEGEPTAELVKLIESGVVAKGPALDVCCGSGSSAIYLAKQGFTCHGIDISPTAIGYARERASKEGVSCALKAGNATELPYPDNTFTLVFDRGCFHSLPPESRETFIRGVHRVLKPKGKFQLICFSAKDHPSTGVPYSFSPGDIRRYFSSFFKIHHIGEISHVHPDSTKHLFLSVLMEKVR